MVPKELCKEIAVNWNERLDPWKDALRNLEKNSLISILNISLGEINLT